MTVFSEFFVVKMDYELNFNHNIVFQGAGATGLGVKMVESVGAARQDVVFDLSCDDVNEVIICIFFVTKN